MIPSCAFPKSFKAADGEGDADYRETGTPSEQDPWNTVPPFEASEPGEVVEAAELAAALRLSMDEHARPERSESPVEQPRSSAEAAQAQKEPT